MTRLRTRKNYVDTAERAQRAKRKRYVKGALFVDPFPLGFGTLPEKIVYAELSRRSIPFYYLNTLPFAIPDIEFLKDYQADFILPDQKIIIEVQGAYWHSMDKTIEEDAFKFAVYQMTGWRPLAWWEYDIQSRITELFAADPVLSTFQYNPMKTSTSELAPLNRVKTDSSQGIRTNNYKTKLKHAYKKPAVRYKYPK